jgi:hypothetical protein
VDKAIINVAGEGAESNVRTEGVKCEGAREDKGKEVIIDELQDNITRKGDMRENIKGKGTVSREKERITWTDCSEFGDQGRERSRRVVKGRNELGPRTAQSFG